MKKPYWDKKKVVRFLIGVIAFGFILKLLQDIRWTDLVGAQSENGNSTVQPTINVIVGTILSLILTYGIGNTSSWIEILKHLQENVPKVSLTIVQTSEKRRSAMWEILPQVKLGKAKYSVYVRAKIKNAGSGTVEQCKLNNEALEAVPIKTNEEKEICIVIPTKNENTKIKEAITCEFEDSLDRGYRVQYELEIDVEKGSVNFKKKEKQRRIFKK